MKKYIIALILIGLVSVAVAQPIVPYITQYIRGLLNDPDAATARTTLGLVIGTDVQTQDSDLDTLSSPTAWRIFYSNGSSVITELPLGSNGQVLTSQGATSTPVFSTPSGSGDMLKSVYDISGDGFVDGNDVVYSSGWNGDVNAVAMNSIYDYLHQFDTDDDGDVDNLDSTVTITESQISDLGSYLESVDVSDNTNLVAGNGLTLTDDTMNFDGGASPGGELGGTWASPTIDDDALDDQYYDSEADLTGLLDDNYEAINSNDFDPDRLNGDAGDNNLLDHEIGGLEADVSAYNGFVKISGGSTSAVTANAGTDITADLEEEVTAGSLANDVILEEDLKVVDSPADEDILTYEITGGDFEWHTKAELGIGTATSITDDLIVMADLNQDSEPSDGDILTYDSTGGNFDWITPNAGTNVTADLEEETHATEHEDGGADEIAVTAGMMNTGTNASSSTFWRGDNTWSTPAGSGDMLKSTYDVSEDGFVDGNDIAYSSAYNGDVNAPSMNAMYDYLHQIDTDDDGDVDNLDGAIECNMVDSDTIDFSITDGNFTGDIIADSIDSVHYAAGSIDAEHLAADIIDETKIADDGIDSEHYNADSIDDEHINWGSGANQVDLADIPGGTAGANAFDFGGATSLEIPNAESADATLTALGQLHIRGDEDRISAHLGSGGEIAGEATMSYLGQVSIALDPGAWYDSGAYVNLFTVFAKKFPNGIIIDYWEVDCSLDPDVEMDLDLCYCDNKRDYADPNIVDVLDTTAGASSEDTDANINAGTAIAAGKVLYLRFGADPEGTCVHMTFEMLFHSEED